jgi:hypothetical protein
MNPLSTLKVAGAVGLVLTLLVGCWKVEAWRERSAKLNQVQGEYAAYRTATTKQLAEKDRQKRINDEISAGYVGIIQKQSGQLADAHTRLAGLRVHIGACPRAVPAAPAGTAAAAGAPAEGADGQSAVVAATDVADRLAACDAVGARLNALVEWTLAQRAAENSIASIHD